MGDGNRRKGKETMQEFKLTMQMPNGKCLGLVYRPSSSDLLWAETGKPVPIASIGIDYDRKPDRQWPVAKAVSPQTPLGKSHAIRALKIQMGLKCNAKCNYCNQHVRPLESHEPMQEAKNFLEGMPSWLSPAGTDGQGEGLRIEFWGDQCLIVEMISGLLKRQMPQKRRA